MSILPLSVLQQALNYFSLSNVPIQDVEYIKVSGIETLVQAEPRTITAAIDPSNMKQLEILFGPGNVSAGDLLIHTKEELYITDIFGLGEAKLQSFLTYSGFSYRILNYQDWMQQAGVRVYQGRRHIRQKVIVEEENEEI